MTITMYDAIVPRNFVGLPNIDALAGYVDGFWPTYTVLDRFAPPGIDLLSIAVFPQDNADCLDVETGDATNGQAPPWFARQVARGAAKPCLYTSAGNAQALINVMAAAGHTRSSYRLWSAHYQAGEHICRPGGCGFPQADGTQWADTVNGLSVDQSLLSASFFAADPPGPSVDPTILETDMFTLKQGAGAVTPIPIPHGTKRVRFASNADATVHIDMMAAGADVDLNLGYNDGAQGFSPPAGALMVVAHRVDDGPNDVTGCYSS
jgi:hypothetical protein